MALASNCEFILQLSLSGGLNQPANLELVSTGHCHFCRARLLITVLISSRRICDLPPNIPVHRHHPVSLNPQPPTPSAVFIHFLIVYQRQPQACCAGIPSSILSKPPTASMIWYGRSSALMWLQRQSLHPHVPVFSDSLADQYPKYGVVNRCIARACRNTRYHGVRFGITPFSTKSIDRQQKDDQCAHSGCSSAQMNGI